MCKWSSLVKNFKTIFFCSKFWKHFLIIILVNCWQIIFLLQFVMCFINRFPITEWSFSFPAWTLLSWVTYYPLLYISIHFIHIYLQIIAHTCIPTLTTIVLLRMQAPWDTPIVPATVKILRSKTYPILFGYLEQGQNGKFNCQIKTSSFSAWAAVRKYHSRGAAFKQEESIFIFTIEILSTELCT